MFIPSLAEKISSSAPWAIYGAVLILFMFVMPSGAIGVFNKFLKKV
jgi:branched-chain amino acid transport system permease protein